MNPVNEWVGTYLERALEPLIRPGFLRVVYGGWETGQYLVNHAGIDSAGQNHHCASESATRKLLAQKSHQPLFGKRGVDVEWRLATMITDAELHDGN